MKPARWRMKLVRSVFFSSLKWPLGFLKNPFLLVFSCPKIDNSTIMISINCLCFQDRHREIVNYPFKESHLRKRSTNADSTLKLVTVYLLLVFFWQQKKHLRQLSNSVIYWVWGFTWYLFFNSGSLFSAAKYCAHQ